MKRRIRRREPSARRRGSAKRCGTVSLEVSIITGIMIPFAVLLFYLSIKICAYIFEVVSALVGWSFL